MGGEEERGALHPDLTPLRLVHGGVGPRGAGLHGIIQVVGVQPDLRDRHLGVVLQETVQPYVRAHGFFSAAKGGR